MTKTPITPAMLKALRADADAALAPLAAKYGLSKLALGRGRYDPEAGTFAFKLEGLGAGAPGKEAALYESAKFLGLPVLGYSFFYSGREYKTSGLNSTATKVICERDDGKKFLFKIDALKRLAAAKAA